MSYSVSRYQRQRFGQCHGARQRPVCSTTVERPLSTQSGHFAFPGSFSRIDVASLHLMVGVSSQASGIDVGNIDAGETG